MPVGTGGRPSVVAKIVVSHSEGPHTREKCASASGMPTPQDSPSPDVRTRIARHLFRRYSVWMVWASFRFIDCRLFEAPSDLTGSLAKFTASDVISSMRAAKRSQTTSVIGALAISCSGGRNLCRGVVSSGASMGSSSRCTDVSGGVGEPDGSSARSSYGSWRRACSSSHRHQTQNLLRARASC